MTMAVDDVTDFDRLFVPIDFTRPEALRAIASDELYHKLCVGSEEREQFSTHKLHQRWLDTREAEVAESASGQMRRLSDEIERLQRKMC